MAPKDERENEFKDETAETTEPLTGEVKPKTRPRWGVNVLVMDSATSWIVCSAVFWILAFSSAFSRVLSMTFIDFVKKFDVSITTTSLSFTLYLVSISITSMVVTNLIVPLVGVRVVSIIGSTLGSLCTICVGMAPNVGLFLLFMTIKGFCFGLCAVPAIAMISQYFEKRRSLATALANCGIGVGAMGSPPIIEYLIENYGLQGAYLLMAAVEMNSIAAAILLRPISRYKTIIRNEQKQKMATPEKTDTDPDPEDTPAKLHKQTGNPTSDPLPSFDFVEDHKTHERIHVEPDSPLTEHPYESAQTDQALSISMTSTGDPSVPIRGTSAEDVSQNHIYLLPVKGKSRMRSTSETDTSVNVSRNGEGTLYQGSASNGSSDLGQLSKSLQLLSTGNGSVSKHQNGTKHHASLLHMPNVSHTISDRLNSTPLHISSTWSVVSSPVDDLAVDVGIFALKSMNTSSDFLSEERGAGHHMDNANTKEKPAGNLCTKTLTLLHNVFNLKLLRLWSMQFLLLSSVTGILIQYLAAYLPTIALKQNIEPDQVSVLLTVSGAVDLVSRIATGAFTDLHILAPTQIVSIAQICVGIVCFFTKFYTTYNMLMFLSVVTGLFGGTRQSLSTLLTIEFMGVGAFLQALGFQAMFGTLSLASHHPMLSAILEATGSFAYPLYYVGIALCVSSAFLLLAPMAKRLDNSKDVPI